MNHEGIIKEIYDKIVSDKLTVKQTCDLLESSVSTATLYQIIKRYSKKHNLSMPFCGRGGKPHRILKWKQEVKSE